MEIPRSVESPPAGAGSAATALVPDRTHRVHIGFIDALRALAALYVMIGHAFAQLLPYQQALAEMHPKQQKLLSFIYVALFRHGHLAVAVFIVISGYCLMLPLARHDKLELDGTGPFLWRRARRILPPYYAALGITLFMMLVVPGMSQVTKGEGAAALPAFEMWTIVSHVLLFHHWSDQWIIKIVPPFWSIGVEWQIYFLMPFLLLPLLRGLGKFKMILASALLGIGLTYAGAGVLPKVQTYIHFIALFAAGMVTAQLCFSPSDKWRLLRERLPAAQWFFVLLTFIAVLLVLQTRASWRSKPLIDLVGRLTWENVWVIDYIVTGCFCALLVALCQEAKGESMKKLYRLLHWAPLVFVGHFSYSFYLIHDPVLRVVCTAGEYLHFSSLSEYIVIFSVGAPLAILSGYLFYLAVEQHFIKSFSLPLPVTPPSS